MYEVPHTLVTIRKSAHLWGKQFAYITSSTEYTVQYTVLCMLKNNVDIFIYCL